MMSAQISRGMASAQAAGAAVMMNGGSLDLFDGPRPDRFGAQTAATLLVTLPLGDVKAEGGAVATTQPLAGYAQASGKPRWYRVNGISGVVMEGDAADMNLLGTEKVILQGARVTLERFSYAIPNAA